MPRAADSVEDGRTAGSCRRARARLRGWAARGGLAELMTQGQAKARAENSWECVSFVKSGWGGKWGSVVSAKALRQERTDHS